MLAMEHEPARLLDPEVLTYIDQFNSANEPSEMLRVFDAKRQDAMSGDRYTTQSFGNLITALALYPENVTTDIDRATRLYETFAASRNAEHVELIIRLLPKLWDYDQPGAQRIAEDCFVRASRGPHARMHQALEAMLEQAYKHGRRIVDDSTQIGRRVVWLSAERHRRRSRQNPSNIA